MVEFLFDRMFFIDILLIAFTLSVPLPKRDHFSLRLLAAGAFCLGTSIIWSFIFRSISPETLGMAILNYLGIFIIVMLVIWFCLQINRWSLIYIGTATYFIQHISVRIEGLLPYRAGMDLLSLLLHMGIVLTLDLAAYGLFFRTVEYHILNRLKLHQVAPIWIIMCLMCLVLSSYASKAGEFTLSFRLADLLCSAVGLLYQYSLYQVAGAQQEAESIQLLLQQGKKQYELSRDSIERVNIKCHDLRHQIRRFHIAGQLDETAIREMEAAINDYDIKVETGNRALDVILTEKRALCTEKGIGFTCMADGRGFSQIEPADLYALFGNALDNAIEAAENLKDSGKKQIALTVRRMGGFCSIHLQNYTDHRLAMADGLPVTNKEDKYNHGFGMRSMRLLVKKYGGELIFQQEGDVVDLFLLLPWTEAAPEAEN